MARAAAAGEWQVDMMSVLFNRLQEQPGLKPESKKATVDILVVNHAEKAPTEN
jgi:uncharacterized protein (TIGR03435 family)